MNLESTKRDFDRVLITGSSGFIGAKVVEMLLRDAITKLRCFVRPSSRPDRLNAVLVQFDTAHHVEIITGDLLSRDDCWKATKGVSIVFHLAAGVEKSFAGAFMNSALATRNLLDAFLEHGKPKRFVNVSSFAVYSNLNLKPGALLDEDCPLENAPQERFDPYAFGKLKQEEIVREYGRTHGLPFVILRPGTVFGPGNPSISGRVGIDSFGFFMHLGGANRLPLTYVDNCAEAIVLAGLVPGVEGETFNVVDDGRVTSADFLKAYKKKTGRSFSISLPYPITRLLCSGWEKYSKWSRGQLPPIFNISRCAAEWQGNEFSNQRLKERLGWSPKVSMDDAMSAYLAQF